MEIRVRFAPSPTGPLHIGNVRAALYNWLFAKHGGGQFLLRIEDTDRVRSDKKYEDDIINGLTWLGISWDSQIYRQSERLDIYEKYLKKLLDENLAYYCFCTSEELEIERQAQLSQGFPPKYSGRCRSFSLAEASKQLELKPAVIRFKIPEKTVGFNDIIRGRVEFDATLLGDIIIAKSLREPLYNFAAAVDDFEMEITHVIRGEDHISNTPKQILIQEGLGLTHPHYAHLPLILGPDRKKLSKRYLENSLVDYKHDGYLREAVINFLVLLGWHPVEDREILSVDEMIKEFDLSRVQKAGAVFNSEKLVWLNSHYIKTLSEDIIFDYLKPFIPAFWLNQEGLIKKIIEVERPRLKLLKDFVRLVSFFFLLPDYSKDLLFWQKASLSTTLNNLKSVLKLIESMTEKEFSKNLIEEKIMAKAGKHGRGEVLWPLRVALSGQGASPGPTELIYILGKSESINRIKIAIDKLN